MAFAWGPPAKKRKQPSFTENELLVLITEVAKRKNILCGSFSSETSRKKRAAAWVEVTEAVNSVSIVHRRENEVRKKFRDFRSDVKRKISLHKSKMTNTGGAPSEKLVLKPSEEAVVNTGLLEQEAVEGLADIVDSEDPDTPVAGPPCREGAVGGRVDGSVVDPSASPSYPSSRQRRFYTSHDSNHPLPEVVGQMLEVQVDLNENVRDVAQSLRSIAATLQKSLLPKPEAVARERKQDTRTVEEDDAILLSSGLVTPVSDESSDGSTSSWSSAASPGPAVIEDANCNPVPRLSPGHASPCSPQPQVKCVADSASGKAKECKDGFRGDLKRKSTINPMAVSLGNFITAVADGISHDEQIFLSKKIMDIICDIQRNGISS